MSRWEPAAEAAIARAAARVIEAARAAAPIVSPQAGAVARALGEIEVCGRGWGKVDRPSPFLQPALEPESWDRTYAELGYTWCRPEQEWHRPPECSIEPDGATSPEPDYDGGEPWD